MSRPPLVQQLLAYSMNTAPLRGLLDRMVSSILESQEQLQALTSLEHHHFEQCSKQLTGLPDLRAEVTGLITCVETWEKTSVRDS